MAIIQNSLKTRVSRVPAAPVRSARGNWAVSDAFATLGALSGSTFTELAYDPSDSVNARINLCLFSHDVPTSLWGASTYSGTLVTAAAVVLPTPLDQIERNIGLTTLLAGGTDMTQATAVAYQQQATVALAAAGISISGFVAQFAPVERGLLSDDNPATAALANLAVAFTSQAGSLFGWAPANATGVPGTDTVVPTILNSASYTEAILDAGNTFTTGAGVVHYVVGLYEVIVVVP